MALRTPAVALMLAHAMRFTLRRPKENLPNTPTPTPNARSKRRRPQTFHSAQYQRAGVRLTELLGGSHPRLQPDGTITLPTWCSKCKKLHGPATTHPPLATHNRLREPRARMPANAVTTTCCGRYMTDEQRVGGENLADN
jgi:hypothetical protein